MASALVSLMTDRPVRPLMAMTGEITLSGNVLPVGGIKEKFLAAKRAGVKDVVLPAENRQNVEEDLMPEQTDGVTIHYASRIEDVLAVALPRSASEEKRDVQGSASGDTLRVATPVGRGVAIETPHGNGDQPVSAAG